VRGHVSLRPEVYTRLQEASAELDTPMAQIVEMAVAGTLAERREIEVSAEAFEALRRGVTIEQLLVESLP
jgi:predicted DNA-binding protein